MHYLSITVERLPFHEKGCNIVYFREDDDAEDVVDIATSAIDKEWRPHKNGMAIGRIYYVTLSMREKYYLRMLLNVVRGCRSWEEICTIDGIEYQHKERLNNQVVFTNKEIQSYTLMEIEMILNGNNRSLTDFLNLPQINHNLLNMGTNRLIAEERSGRTGKTYLWNTIIALIRSQGKIVLSVASSGIASLLLPGGRTSHLRFRIPIDLDSDSCCGSDVTSDLAELIRQTRNQVFIGKVVVLGGDFRQILLVIPNARRSEIVSSAINKLPAVALDQEDEATWITILNGLLILVNDDPISAIVQNAFPNLLNKINDIDYLKERCILCPTNEIVDKINSHVWRRCQVPEKLINKYKNLIVEGQVHNIHRFMVREYTMLYRSLDRKIFVEFCRVTSVKRSSLPTELFDIYVFEFIPFNMLGSRAKNDTYLTDVIGVLCEWGPVGENEGGSKSAHPHIRKIVVCDTMISLWGKLALKYIDGMIRSQKDTNIIVILTTCRVRRYGGTEFIISSMVIGIDLYNDWKFIRCPTCCHKVDWANVHYYCKECIKNVTIPRQTYKLVITIGTQDDEEINCVLFNTIVNQLLGYTVEELLTKSIKELDDFFVDKLIGQSIVLSIKTNKYNLAPTFVRRMMDEIQWGFVSGSTTPIPKTAIEVPLSTLHEVRAPNMEHSKDRFKNGIKCETNTTIIDTFEGSPARATMTNEDNSSDTHTDIATSHAYNDAVYVRSEALKEADTKVFNTKEAVMMEVVMKECDMRQVDVKEVVIDEEDMNESNVKKDNMKQVDMKEAVMDEENTKESYVKKDNMKQVDVKETVMDEEDMKEAYVKKMIRKNLKYE
nr:replication factor A protein 1 [Tanacetum cinerariifolium]